MYYRAYGTQSNNMHQNNCTVVPYGNLYGAIYTDYMYKFPAKLIHVHLCAGQ